MQADKKKFDLARKIYPGIKRGIDTEFRNFQKHKDWKDVLDGLYKAIRNQDNWRRNAVQGEFIPQWPYFKTWINQRRWEEEIPVREVVKSASATDDENRTERVLDQRTTWALDRIESKNPKLRVFCQMYRAGQKVPCQFGLHLEMVKDEFDKSTV